MPLTLDASNPGKIIFTLTGLVPQYVNRAEFKLFEIDGTTLLDTLEFSFQDGDDKSYIFGHFDDIELDHHYTVTAQTFDSQDRSTLHLWQYIWTKYHINKHCVNIGGFNCYDEWGLIPAERPVIVPPSVKSNYVELPGSNESIDYTQLLDGKVHYGQRIGSWTFYFDPEWSKDGIAPNPDRKKVEGKLWSYVYNSLLNKIHGKRMYVVLADDPGNAYYTRLKVNKWSSNGKLSQVTIDYESVPKPIESKGLLPGYLTFYSPNGPAALNFHNAALDPDPYPWDGIIEYSTDRVSWQIWDGSLISFGVDNKLYLRGINNTYITGPYSPDAHQDPDGYFEFSFNSVGDDSVIDCDGYIDSLLDYRMVQNRQHPPMADGCFQWLFAGAPLRTAPDFLNRILTIGCYEFMFENCYRLTTAPRLPSTNLAQHCYQSMFDNCTSLIEAPKLPATTLASYCYCNMFSGCTSLVKAPKLPAKTLDSYCCEQMFIGCTSLTDVPDLPEVALKDHCYYNMFFDCTSLVKAPKLLAKALDSYCCYYMFYNCTSLTDVPDLPEVELKDYCYDGMFSGCTSLVKAPKLSAKALAHSCCYNMFENCTSLTDVPDLPDVKFDRYCYSHMFVGCTSLVKAPAFLDNSPDRNIKYNFANDCCAYMFYGCTSLIEAPKLPAQPYWVGSTELEPYGRRVSARCFDHMFAGCVSLNRLPYLSADLITSGSYRSMFEGCELIKLFNNQTAEHPYPYRVPHSIHNAATGNPRIPISDCIPNMFKNTGGEITDNFQVNTIYYVENEPV